MYIRYFFWKKIKKKNMGSRIMDMSVDQQEKIKIFFYFILF